MKNNNVLDKAGTVADFVTELEEKKIKLWVDNGTLRFKAPKGVVTKEILNSLKNKKEDIIAFLQRNNVSEIFSAPIKRIEDKEYYPLSAAQLRMFLLNQMDRESIAYNLTQVFKINGKFDKDRLTEVLVKLMERHEALRTSYTVKDGQPVQIIHKKIDFKLDYAELEDKDGELYKAIKKFIRPYDLSAAPLFRVKLIKLKDKTDSYYLVYDMHHIISDGVSEAIMVDEVNKLYAEMSLPELKIRYVDFAAWHENLLESDAVKAQEKFWKEQLNGELPLLNLAADYPRPSKFSFKGDSINFQIDKALTSKLYSLAHENRVTLYAVLLAAYNALLYKYTGQTDVIVGSPSAGRRHVDTLNIVGVFVNSLPLRNYPKGDKTFEEFLSEVGKNSFKALDNQDFPFEQLVESLGVQRDLSRNPIFDTMFVLQNMNTGNVKMEGLEISRVEYHVKMAQFDVSVFATENENGIDIEINYYTDIFKKSTIERFGKHYINILKYVTENKLSTLNDIEMLTSEEKKQILNQFNDTGAEYNKNITINELFEKQVEKTPEDTALIFEDNSMTYKELNEKANQLAGLLRQKGVKPDSIVGIMTERSSFMFIGIMAILKAGGAYMPISPDYPDERIKYMLEDSGACALLTQNENDNKRIKDADIKNIAVINLDNQNLFTGNSGNLECINNSKNLAYIIYTSGSTGKPKGVMIEHWSLVNRLNWMQKMYPIGKGDTILQKTPYTFDVSVWEMFWWSIQGARVCFLKPGGEKDPSAIVEAIEKNKITTMHFVPSMLTAFLNYIENNIDLRKLSSLKQVFSSGEALNLQQVLRFNKLLYKANGTKLHNLYGPTEATVDVSYFNCSTGENFEVIPIGKPIDNINLYIMSSKNKLQPIGVPGELCIAGDGLARGYLNRPELTAEKFVPNPFNQGKRMYRTGDMARWMPDGNIEYLGRMDHQVKIRGFRIELDEIQKQLIRHDNVKEAVVLAREDSSGSKYLCAYITADRAVTVPELRKHLLEKLPDYMVPAYFVQLDKMPLTPNGKIDRKALPESGAYVNTGIEYVEPSNPLQKNLAQIWKKVLNKDKIGIKDDFFDIGGNSLLVIQLVSEMKKIGIELKVSEIFKYPTIEKIEDYLASTDKDISVKELAVSEMKAEEAGFRIIGGVSENNDQYEWRQLDCFYRPLAILFESFKHEYFDLFLFYVSFYTCFMADGWFTESLKKYDTPHILFFDFCNKFLNKRFGLKVNKLDVSSEEELHAKIRNEINNGSPVIVPIDLFSVYYFERYMEEHHRHYLVIKGYSDKKKLYYIVDNIHLDGGASTIYKDFNMKQSELYEMFETYYKNFAPEKSPYFWSLSRDEQNDKDITYADALIEHYELLKKVESNTSDIKYLFCEAINQMQSSGNAENCQAAVWLTNFKDVYYDLLCKFLLKTSLCEKDISPLKDIITSIKKAWKEIELSVMDRVAEKNSDFTSLEPLVKEAAAKEKTFREMIIGLIEKSGIEKVKKQLQSGNLSAFAEKNNLKANIITQKDKIRMELSSKVVYNTWLTNDEAPQMLISLKHDKDFTIESRVTNIDVKNPKSDCCLSGLIVKFKNGTKLMFCIYKDGDVEILCPENGDNVVLFARKFPNEIKSQCLKVEKLRQMYNFYLKENQDDQWEKVFSIKSSGESGSFGLIARTWEMTDQIVEFDNIKYEIK